MDQGVSPDLAESVEVCIPQSIISDHYCRLLEGAKPVYPGLPAGGNSLGETTCIVSFTVNDDGKPFDIEANCENALFERSAARGVSHVQYRALNYDCKPCPQIGKRIEYPIEYRLSKD